MTDRHALLKFVVFTLGCLALAGWLVVTIGNIAIFADRDSYEAEFVDARGLVENDAVKIAGVSVGKVTGIDVERGRAIVRFELDDDVRLGRDTEVAIRWRNTLGLRYLYVLPAGDGDLEPGHRFDLAHTRGLEDLNVLLERLTPVMRALSPEKSNIVVRELSTALQGNEEEVRQLVADAGELFEALGQRSDQVAGVLDNGATLLEAYAGREEQLRALLTDFAGLSESLAARNQVLVDAITEIAGVEGELARFLEANDGDLRGLIAELDQAAAILSVNHRNLEEIFTTTGQGIVAYHRISRWGQWFNIRVPGYSEG
ncbi:MAG: MCE family protein, partial [Nitriliruptorales bacterium]|nr:MCE family protein [Nitriliruptorales bacterium]